MDNRKRTRFSRGKTDHLRLRCTRCLAKRPAESRKHGDIHKDNDVVIHNGAFDHPPAIFRRIHLGADNGNAGGSMLIFRWNPINIFSRKFDAQKIHAWNIWDEYVFRLAWIHERRSLKHADWIIRV